MWVCGRVGGGQRDYQDPSGGELQAQPTLWPAAVISWDSSGFDLVPNIMKWLGCSTCPSEPKHQTRCQNDNCERSRLQQAGWESTSCLVMVLHSNVTSDRLNALQPPPCTDSLGILFVFQAVDFMHNLFIRTF